METIREAESADAPSASVISQPDIDAELRHGTSHQGGKLRVYRMYQQEITAKDAVQALKKEYGTSGHSHTFLDGTRGFVDYSPSAGMKMRRYQPNAEIKVTWTRIEKRIRQMVQEGSYLTPEELEKYQSDHLEQVPDSQSKPPVLEQSPAIRITQDEIDAKLRDELLTKRQLDIYAIYQRNLTVEETVEAIKSVFGRAAD